MTLKHKDLYAVILAGGSGTRFWPLSREMQPKQFLKIIDDTSLLQQTVARIKVTIKPSNIYIVTNQKYAGNVAKQLQGTGVFKKNIMCEPEGKNTASAVLWACTVIYRKNKNAIFSILPSDHLITEKNNFIKCFKKAYALAAEGYLVTFGIKPTRLDTGFGYLKTKLRAKGIYKVEQFKEKPALSVAQKYLKSGNYFWNSGMFVWKCQTLMAKFKQHAPDIYNLIGENNTDTDIVRNWQRLPSISVDYAILEKDTDVMAVEAKNIGWSDLGSWDSLLEILSKDKNGNILKGDVLANNSGENYVFSSKKLVAISDVDDLIIVDTTDALLVCRRGSSQNVKILVDHLKKNKRKEI